MYPYFISSPGKCNSYFPLRRKGIWMIHHPALSQLPTQGPDTPVQTLTCRSPLDSNLAPSRCSWGTRAASPLCRGRPGEEATLGAHAGLKGHLPNSLAQGPELHVDILIQIYCHLPRGTRETEAAEHGLGREHGILQLDAPPPIPRLIITQCLGRVARYSHSRFILHKGIPPKTAPFTSQSSLLLYFLETEMPMILRYSVIF